MPRARTLSERQTAAPNRPGGCLSGLMLPPLAVILVGILLASFVYSLNPRVPAGGISNPENREAGPAGLLSPLFTDEVQHWAESIVRWAASAGLDPNLAAVVMQIESCGDPRAHSRAGAMGLFQVMPYHFAALEDPYNPDTNATRGMAYLRRSLEAAGGNARLALAGYNGGIGAISRGESTWSAETLRYVRYGYPIFEDAHRGAITSTALEEWYNRYGASLCRGARQRLGIP